MASTDKNPVNGNWYPPPTISDADKTKNVKKRNKKNSKKVPPSSAVQGCPYAPKPAPKVVPKKDPCNFSALKVSKTPDRKFDLIVARGAKPDKRVLGVKAGFKDKPAKVTLELQGPVGPCAASHINKRSFDTGSGKFKILSSTESKLELEFTSSVKVQVFPWGFAPDKYTISANRCDHRNSTIIEVYPDTEFEIFLGFDFGEKLTKKTGQQTKVTQGYRADGTAGQRLSPTDLRTQNTNEKWKEETNTVSGFRCGGNLKYDGHEYKIETVFSKTIQTIKKVTKFIESVQVSLEKLRENKAAAGRVAVINSPVSLGFQFPLIDISVGGSWEEDAGKSTVTYKGKIKFKATPIFGLAFEWNITETILTALPGGVIVTKIKKMCTDGFLDLVLKANAHIEGELECDFKNWTITPVKGLIKGKVPIILKLTLLKVSFDTVVAHGTTEQKLSIEGGVEAEVSYSKEEQKILGEWRVLKLEVWWYCFIEGGVGKKTTNPSWYQDFKRPADNKVLLHTFDIERKGPLFTPYEIKHP